MRRRIESRELRSEKGSVLLLVVMALTAILGIVGLAMDAGQLYVTYQQAQAAADAAVLAGARDMLQYTGFAVGFHGTNITCTPTSTQSPCVYAQLNGFGLNPPPGSTDTVTIKFFQCPAPKGVNLVSFYQGPGSLICATISRVVPTTFLRVLGTNMSTVTVTAEAALIGGNSLTPLTITHPHLDGALTISAPLSSIIICGGSNNGIQVNSDSQMAIQNGGLFLNLSHGGPLDSGLCDNGTGSNVRVVGQEGQGSAGNLVLGTTGQYVSGVSATLDPLASISPPPQPGTAPAPRTVVPTDGYGCLVPTCTLYSPGTYSSSNLLSVPPNATMSSNALFLPGIYYITSGGFQVSAGCMAMASGPSVTADTLMGWTQNMLVYNTGPGTLNIGGSFGQLCGGVSSNSLQGSPADSTYQGIFFYEDRDAPPQQNHYYSVIGNFTINGIIYMNSTNPAQYQALTLQGGALTVNGEIMVGSLTVTGGYLFMNVAPGQTNIPQIALVQYPVN